MSVIQPRQRRASTGRFTATALTAPETNLDTDYDEDSDSAGYYECAEMTVSETPEFDRRVRLLLGVADQSAPVTTFTEHGETGDYTIESWDSVTVACAGLEFSLDGPDALPRMLRRIEHIDQEKPRDTVMRYLGRAEPRGEGDVILHFDTGHELVGHIKFLSAVDVFVEGRVHGIALTELTHITSAT
jgi:hypothetical protein